MDRGGFVKCHLQGSLHQSDLFDSILQTTSANQTEFDKTLLGEWGVMKAGDGGGGGGTWVNAKLSFCLKLPK